MKKYICDFCKKDISVLSNKIVKRPKLYSEEKNEEMKVQIVISISLYTPFNKDDAGFNKEVIEGSVCENCLKNVLNNDIIKVKDYYSNANTD